MFNILDPGRFAARHKVGRPLQVYVRVRPNLKGEEDQHTSVKCVFPDENDNTMLRLQPPPNSQTLKSIGDGESQLTFHQVFGPDATQQDVFNTSTVRLCHKAINNTLKTSTTTRITFNNRHS